MRTVSVAGAAALGIGKVGSAHPARSAPHVHPGGARRKLRVGIVGYGQCRFGAAFGFQDHPGVEVVAVSDLFADRCRALAEACRCPTTYPSLEELLKDERVEAVFLATDAPSHARHTLEALRRGKHVAVAVPAVYGSLEDAEKVYEEVRRSGLTYTMFETSCFRPDCWGMRQIYHAGGFGKLVYSEGEYYHYFPTPLASHENWREGLPPLWYPTHSTAYYVCVTGGSFTKVSCAGFESELAHLRPDGNRYNNPFGTEIALLRTNEGGMSRMTCSWDTPGLEGEVGRVRGQLGSMTGTKYRGVVEELPSLEKPALPEGVAAGGHGGSHGHLGHEFAAAVLDERRPLIDVAMALNLTVPGIVAHESAMRDGEWLDVPQYQSL